MISFRLKQWLGYRRHALSRHGVHSPFLYDFIDKGLRRKSGSVAARVYNYFQSSQIVEIENPTIASTALQQANEGTIVLIKNIHSTSEALAAWQALCTQSPVTMSVDLFELGILLFHKEFKVPQHFILKRY